jgi:hypothetical protein
MLTRIFLEKGDGAVYYMWNGTKDSSMKFDQWSYRSLAKQGFNEIFAGHSIKDSSKKEQKHKTRPKHS